MSNHQEINNSKYNPISESILDDIDTVELFNRETYFNNEQRWLEFINEKHYNGNEIRLDIDEISKESEYKEQCLLVQPQKRIDCNPDLPITRERCLKRGCCWDSTFHQHRLKIIDFPSKNLPPIDVPYCFYSADYRGYKIIENHTDDNGNFNIQLERIRPSGFPVDIRHLTMKVSEISSKIVRISLTDSEKPRYMVSIPELNIPQGDNQGKSYQVELIDGHLSIRRRYTNRTIFDLNLNVMIFSDQFIQVTSVLPSDFIYGLGEHREPFRKQAQWKRYTMFNRDQYPIPDASLYGSHPFYMMVEELETTRPASGVFLFNSNAMDIITQPAPSITFRTIGGILDFFIFLGPTPEQVTQQYHRLIGLPAMPPYWSLGFHLSRFGYRNIEHLNETFIRNQNAGIPMDVQWTDIDIMEQRNDFTLDQKRFGKLPEFIEKILHPNGIRFIPMFDPGVSGSEKPGTYPPYDLGIEMDVFIKNSTGNLFRGRVWNIHSTVWPDFFHPNATGYWTKMFQDYHRLIPFDGAWIDMNEPSNMIDGQIDFECPVDSILENPPYTPGMISPELTLRRHTICMTAKHYFEQLHYNLHNLYGFKEAIVTNQALKTVLGDQKRPFIISRSTAPGHGHYAHHWSGDIVSDWPSMKWSIASMLNFNLFGIPMVGSDICGFNGNTTEELCARWHQLGAFYPFSRNHNTDDAVDQDPASMSPAVIRTIRGALRSRYAHLPYLYTLFWNVHNFGGTVVRPLFFEFQHDPQSYKIDTQFMWGSSLMVAPTLSPNITTMEVYFPPGVWFTAGTREHINSGPNGRFIKILISDIYPNLFYRSGSIIPVQKPLQTTEKTLRENYKLFVLLENESASASGSLYFDSGDGPINNQYYNHYSFSVKEYTLKINSDHLGYETKKRLQEITILGFFKKPKTIFLDKRILNEKFIRYNHEQNSLTLVDLYLPLYPGNNNNDSSSTSVTYKISWKF